MRRALLAAVACAAFVWPATAAAQGFAIAGRVGTLGVGGEVAIGVLPKIGLRAGIGAIPFSYDGELSGITYTVEPPSTIMNIGIDLFPGAGGFRLSGGVMFKDDITFSGDYEGSVEFGNRTYTGSGTITGFVDHKSMAPYATIGWGWHAGPGVGLFLDLGAAALGEPTVVLEEVTGPAGSEQSQIEAERQQMEEDLQTYMKVLPILSIGLRIGLK